MSRKERVLPCLLIPNPEFHNMRINRTKCVGIQKSKFVILISSSQGQQTSTLNIELGFDSMVVILSLNTTRRLCA